MILAGDDLSQYVRLPLYSTMNQISSPVEQQPLADFMREDLPGFGNLVGLGESESEFREFPEFCEFFNFGGENRFFS